MERFPLVSVICLCYNHEQFVQEALESVFSQTYPHIEIIVVDDASTDTSVAVISEVLAKHQGHSIKTRFLSENQGNCKAFNEGFALAQGKYVIDFATDDVLIPDRIGKQVQYFESLPDSFGVVFTEAAYIDSKGQHLYYHFKDRFSNIYPAHLQQEEKKDY